MWFWMVRDLSGVGPGKSCDTIPPCFAEIANDTLGKIGTDDRYAFFESPTLVLGLFLKFCDFMGRKPNSLMRPEGVIGHDVRHDLLRDRFRMQNREMVSLEISVVRHLPI